MARYAVGDIQGCYEPLTELLALIEFDWQTDELWCVGDLINRGPKSLEVLRFLYAHRDCVRAVLGNHDLHFLAVYYGLRPAANSDTFDALLAAPDVNELVQWLRSLPLACRASDQAFLMVHAGVAPQWTLNNILDYSDEVSRVLQSEDAIEFLGNMYGNQPAVWHNDLIGMDRLRCITNYFTRMRFCSADGTLDLYSKESVDTAPAGFAPWFSFLSDALPPIVFGHWAALQGNANSNRVHALDTGCVWGNALTALNLETGARTSIGCPINLQLNQQFIKK